MIRDCESCGARYDDEFSWTICPHMPLEAGPIPFHVRSNPNGYCRRCDRLGPHECIEVEERRRAQERAPRVSVRAAVRLPDGQPVEKNTAYFIDSESRVVCKITNLAEPQALPVAVEVDEDGRHVTTASEAPLPHGFIGAGIVLKEGQSLELLPDGSARIRRSPTDEWEHHEAHTEMARILWACAAPLAPIHVVQYGWGASLRIAAIDYVGRTITLELDRP